MTAYAAFAHKTNSTPQTEIIPGREKDMVFNAAGGANFAIDPMQQFRRFLILGSEGGTYYVKEQQFTKENAANAYKVLNSAAGPSAVKLIEEISTKGLAPKVSPVLFALALAFSVDHIPTKHAAVGAFKHIVRTNSHMLEFVSYANELRGWGRLLRETVRSWYNTMDPNRLAYQVAKYRNRHKWTTRDVLRMSKPKPQNKTHSAIYQWAVGKGITDDAPSIFSYMDEAASIKLIDKKSIVHAISIIDTAGLTREMIPNSWLDSPDIWAALLQKMPLTAMIRNLGKMSQVGLLTPFSEAADIIESRLNDETYLKASRVHPLGILLALTTYQAGHGVRGSLVWDPVLSIVDVLNDAFYTTFSNVKPTGKNTLLALDVSGSMTQPIANTHLSCREATAALAMVTARTESSYEIMGFSTTFMPLNISKHDSLAAAVDKISRLPFSGTNCAIPMEWALNKKMPVEAFAVYTDNETWYGRNEHPKQALDKFRQRMNIPAKLAVVGMTATNSSIADPLDPGMLDLVGFDASAPAIMADFFRS